MNNIFMISDLHFGHENTCKFSDSQGSKLRPFSCAEEMDQHLIDSWNKVVGLNDRVYVLGDVAMKRRDIKIISLCKGRKVLVRGNHDIFNLEDYTPYFDDIRGVHVMPSRLGILSHVPLHPDSVERFKLNIHGHLHDKNLDDHRYFSVCVERINYTPISYDVILNLTGHSR